MSVTTPPEAGTSSRLELVRAFVRSQAARTQIAHEIDAALERFLRPAAASVPAPEQASEGESSSAAAGGARTREPARAAAAQHEREHESSSNTTGAQTTAAARTSCTCASQAGAQNGTRATSSSNGADELSGSATENADDAEEQAATMQTLAIATSALADVRAQTVDVLNKLRALDGRRRGRPGEIDDGEDGEGGEGATGERLDIVRAMENVERLEMERQRTTLRRDQLRRVAVVEPSLAASAHEQIALLDKTRAELTDEINDEMQELHAEIADLQGDSSAD